MSSWKNPIIRAALLVSMFRVVCDAIVKDGWWHALGAFATTCVIIWLIIDWIKEARK